MEEESAKARIAALRRAATQCRLAAKAARERALRAQRRQDATSFSRRRQDEALLVYLLAGDSLQAAVEYLVHVSSKAKGFDDAARGALGGLVQGWFLSRSMEDLRQLQAPVTPSARARATAARRYVAQRGLTAWVREANEGKGLAPPSRQLHAVVDACAADVPELPGLPAAAPVSRRTARAQRQWVWRWRRRWGAKMGKVRARDDLSQEVMAAKATRAEEKEQCRASL